MALRHKQHRKQNSKMDSGPPEKMDQPAALREFIDRVEAMAKNNYFSVNLEFAVSPAFYVKIISFVFRNYEQLRRTSKFRRNFR